MNYTQEFYNYQLQIEICDTIILKADGLVNGYYAKDTTTI